MRLALAASCAALVAVPFLLVLFPPIADLSQHAAQIRLFLEALRDPESPYVVQWLTPYGLSYLILGMSWAAFGPIHAGRIGALALALMWVGAVHWLAWRRQRSLAAATLASALVFNHTLYWGFLSFVAGWPLFALWLEETEGARARSWSPATGLRLLGCGALLYFTHALWFAVAGLWLALRGLVDRLPWKVQLLRVASLTPVALVA